MSSLAHETQGDPFNPAVVFLHGFMGSRADWAPLVKRLAKSFFCITIDLPGHGASPISGDDDFVHTGAAVIEIIDDLDIATFAVAGYSMGGRLALYMAIHYSMRIDALVCESASAGLRDEAERRARRDWENAMAKRLRAGDFQQFVQDWYDQPLFASLKGYPALLEATIAQRHDNDPAKLAKAMVQLGTGNQPGLWDELSEHYLPSLFIAGELDDKYSKLAREMAELCAEGQAHIVPGAGHNVHAEQPEAYADAVETFLTKALRP